MARDTDAQRKTLTLDDEEQLLQRLQRGEQRAFRTLYDAFAQRLYRCIILPKLGLPDVAEDILRDTFLTAFEKIDRVRWQNRSLYYWLARIASNKVIDFHRANRRTERFVQGFTPYLELSNPGPRGPEDAYLSEEHLREVHTLIHTLLDRLNDRYRKAIELRFFEERSREECAQIMDVTIGNFDVILFRAIKRLKTLHQKHGHDR